MKIASAIDYREAARRRLPRFLFEYIDGGSYAELTLRQNIADLQNIALRQRVMRDVGQVDTSCELFGQNLALPIALGPTGLAGMNTRRGEVQAARAAEAAGIPFCLSTVSACALAAHIHLTDPVQKAQIKHPQPDQLGHSSHCCG